MIIEYRTNRGNKPEIGEERGWPGAILVRS